MDRYLRHRQSRDWYRVACDEDTRYYLFDDSAEPVGLTAEDKTDWEPITREAYQSRARSVCTTGDDLIQSMFSQRLLDRAKGLHGSL